MIPPHLHETLIPRPRLLDGLAQGLRRPLTLVLAPAGAGKTALLQQWAQLAGPPVAWLTLAEADRDPGHFLARLARALREVQAGLGERSLAALQRGQGLEATLVDLLNEAAQTPGTWALVLDNFQALAGSPVATLATPWLDYLPPHLHLYLAGRTQPALALGRLRVRGRLVELGWPELNFTLEETAALLRTLGRPVSSAQASALQERTEGWALGVVRAAQAIAAGADPAPFIARFTGSHPAVAAYLIEEVLLRQPDDVQAFLLQTAHLPKLNAALCNAATGRRDGQAILEALERVNLFLIPLDAERHSYRYHRLFAQFLAARAAGSEAALSP